MKFWGIRSIGHLIDISSIALLLAGPYTLLRRLGGDRKHSVCLVLLLLATRAGQTALLSIRGDLLPVTLVIGGIVVCWDPMLIWAATALAAALFSLAFAAKGTSAYGVAAVCLFLLVSSHLSRAWRLFFLTTAGFTIVVVATYIASEGCAWQMMRIFSLGGGTPGRLIKGPALLLQAGAADDPTSLAFFPIGYSVLFVLPKRTFPELPPCFFSSPRGL